MVVKCSADVFSLPITGRAGPWVREHAQSLLPCLPASGADLTALMNQLGLELP